MTERWPDVQAEPSRNNPGLDPSVVSQVVHYVRILSEYATTFVPDIHYQ